MRKRPAWLLVLFAALLMPGAVAAQEQDAEGSKDHPLFNRMPGYYISRYENREFDSHPFNLGNGKELSVEGRVIHILYSKKENAQEASRLQVLRNYESAVKKIGGTVLASDIDGSSFMKVVKGDQEIWVHVDAYITSEFSLWVVEKQLMKQDIVANAEALGNDITSSGHAAVYGIYFDTDKAEIKPESEAALKEVASLLAKNPAWKLLVVGHTDMTGDLAHNMQLSEQRGAPVVTALTTKYGIAPVRLKGYGVGPLAPVASNDTEGRAKNRRVELVKQ